MDILSALRAMSSNHETTCSCNRCTYRARMIKLRRKQKPATVVKQMVLMAETLRNQCTDGDDEREIAQIDGAIALARRINAAKTQAYLAAAHVDLVNFCVQTEGTKRRALLTVQRRMLYLYGARCTALAKEALAASPVASTA